MIVVGDTVNHPGATGVSDTLTGVHWTAGMDDALVGWWLSSIGDTCYVVGAATGDVNYGIYSFANDTWQYVAYAPAEFAVAPLHGDGSRFYFPLAGAVHSTTDFATWATTSITAGETIIDAAMGSDGFYILSMEASGLPRVYKVAANGASASLALDLTALTGFNYFGYLAMVGTTPFVYSTFVPGESGPVYYTNSTLTGDTTTNPATGYAIRNAQNAMSGLSGVYAAKVSFSSFGPVVEAATQEWSAGGTSFNPLAISAHPYYSTKTQAGIVGPKSTAIDGFTTQVVAMETGAVVETMDFVAWSAGTSAAFGAIGQVPPFWTNRHNCVESA